MLHGVSSSIGHSRSLGGFDTGIYVFCLYFIWFQNGLFIQVAVLACCEFEKDPCWVGQVVG